MFIDLFQLVNDPEKFAKVNEGIIKMTIKHIGRPIFNFNLIASLDCCTFDLGLSLAQDLNIAHILIKSAGHLPRDCVT